MKQSPSWATNRFSASQEIPHILWDLKVHYDIHKCPPPVPVLRQLDPVHTTTSHFWRMIIHVHVYSSSQEDCLLMLGFSPSVSQPHLLILKHPSKSCSLDIFIIIFRCIHKIPKSDFQLCHVCPSVHMEQLGSHGTDFH